VQQLDAMEGQGAPPDPRCPLQTGRLRDLPGLQDPKQRRVDDQGLRVAHELRHQRAPKGLQVELYAERGRGGEARKGGEDRSRARQKVREEPLGIAQERALGVDAPQLLDEGQAQDLRVRELLKGLVSVPLGV
jgi:hypothetical protein